MMPFLLRTTQQIKACLAKLLYAKEEFGSCSSSILQLSVGSKVFSPGNKILQVFAGVLIFLPSLSENQDKHRQNFGSKKAFAYLSFCSLTCDYSEGPRCNFVTICYICINTCGTKQA